MLAADFSLSQIVLDGPVIARLAPIGFSSSQIVLDGPVIARLAPIGWGGVVWRDGWFSSFFLFFF